MARDALLIFGNLSLATKDTPVYSADILDLNDPAVQHSGRNHVNIVFQPGADFAAIDGFVPLLQDSADGSTWATIRQGAEKTAPTDDDQVVIEMPTEHRRYLRAGATPKSTGVFTAKTVSAWVELGR
jgi:hypothetical protein